MISPKIVFAEIADIYARERMGFLSNFVISKSPNLMDLGLWPANTMNRLKAVISPNIRVEGMTDIFDWLMCMHGWKEVMVGRVRDAKVFSDYIKNNEFETIKVFEWENISVTQPTSLPETLT